MQHYQPSIAPLATSLLFFKKKKKASETLLLHHDRFALTNGWETKKEEERAKSNNNERESESHTTRHPLVLVAADECTSYGVSCTSFCLHFFFAVVDCTEHTTSRRQRITAAITAVHQKALAKIQLTTTTVTGTRKMVVRSRSVSSRSSKKEKEKEGFARKEINLARNGCCNKLANNIEKEEKEQEEESVIDVDQATTTTETCQCRSPSPPSSTWSSFRQHWHSRWHTQTVHK